MFPGNQTYNICAIPETVVQYILYHRQGIERNKRPLKMPADMMYRYSMAVCQASVVAFRYYTKSERFSFRESSFLKACCLPVIRKVLVIERDKRFSDL